MEITVFLYLKFYLYTGLESFVFFLKAGYDIILIQSKTLPVLFIPPSPSVNSNRSHKSHPCGH